MSALANLKLVAAKRAIQLSPAIQRRNKITKRLWEQIELAKAQTNGTIYAPMKLHIIKDSETGETKTVSVPKRITEWWFLADTGKLCVSLRYGAKVIELAKGKTAVELASNDQLVSTLEALKQAVENGELDLQLELVCGAVKSRATKAR